MPFIVQVGHIDPARIVTLSAVDDGEDQVVNASRHAGAIGETIDVESVKVGILSDVEDALAATRTALGV